MKICKYCETEQQDNLPICSACGGNEFKYKCDNCGNIFGHGNFCPNCGVKVGKTAKKCPICGAEYFSLACPDCGYTTTEDNTTIVNPNTQSNQNITSWLWAVGRILLFSFGWIFILPLPLTVLLLKNQKSKNWIKNVKIVIITITWIIYLFIASAAVVGIVTGTGSANSSTTNTVETNQVSSTEGSKPNNDITSEQSSIAEASKLTFTITAGKAGKYGKLITYNKETEFEETFYAYYVPAGTYTVTNKGKYMSQINVYSNKKRITEEGWEEPGSGGYAKLLDINKSDKITIKNGYHIEIHEPDVFELTQQ